MRAKAASTCGIAIAVDIVRTRGACILEHIVDKVVQGLYKRRRGRKLDNHPSTTQEQPSTDSLVRVPAKDARGHGDLVSSPVPDNS